MSNTATAIVGAPPDRRVGPPLVSAWDCWLGSRFTMESYIDNTVLLAFAVENKYLLVQYQGARKWRERFVTLRPTPSSDPRSIGWCVVATPDGDVYGEPLAIPNVPAVSLLPDDPSLPPGVLRRNVYRFEDGSIGQELGGPEIAHLRGLAQAELVSFCRMTSTASAGGAVAAAPTANTAPLLRSCWPWPCAHCRVHLGCGCFGGSPGSGQPCADCSDFGRGWLAS